MYNKADRNLGATEVATEPSYWESLATKGQQAIKTMFNIYGQYEQLQNVTEMRKQAERARQETAQLIQAQQQAEMMQAAARQQQMVTGGGFNIQNWILPIGVGAVGLLAITMMRKRR